MIMPCLGARRKPSSNNISGIASRQHSIANDKSIPTSLSASINVSRTGSTTSHQSAAAAAAVAQIRQECNDLKSMV